ncbi:MAG: NifU N-terminal domain-containing protein [Phycisphaerae bacterium]|nr:NifU N-terminal domain-containing protein [Phycisphaerae bacterium]
MPLRVVEFQPTPNPNAIKCLLDRAVADAPRSFRAPESAGDDAIASRLFAIDGVTNVLILGDWLTVGKTPAVPWPAMKRAIAAALAQVP